MPLRITPFSPLANASQTTIRASRKSRMKFGHAAAIALVVLAALSCAPIHGSLQEMRQDHVQVWCSVAPPRSYTRPAIETDAPYSKWGLNQCFFDSLTKCQLATEQWRWRAQWRVWFPEKPTTGMCGLCAQRSPFPATTYVQELEIFRDRENAAICMSLDDPRIQGTEFIGRSYIF